MGQTSPTTSGPSLRRIGSVICRRRGGRFASGASLPMRT